MRQLNGTYNQYKAENPSSINLFKGSKMYGATNLANAFYGTAIGEAAKISLYHISTTGSLPIDLASLPVRISGAMA